MCSKFFNPENVRNHVRLRFEPWPKQMQMRCYSGLPVQTNVLRFFETTLLMVQRGATLLSPTIGFDEFASFHSAVTRGLQL